MQDYIEFCERQFSIACANFISKSMDKYVYYYPKTQKETSEDFNFRYDVTLQKLIKKSGACNSNCKHSKCEENRQKSYYFERLLPSLQIIKSMSDKIISRSNIC